MFHAERRRIHFFGKNPRRSKIIAAAARVYVINRLGEVLFLKQVTPEAAYVRLFKGEASRQLVLKGDVEGFGVGSLEMAIDAPIDVEAVDRGSEREGLGG